MDLDAYVAAHAADWQRLAALTRQRRLSGPESDELVELYQRVATQLSVVRTSAPDAAVIAYLSALLARARNRAVGTRIAAWAGVRRFFLERFPAALYRLRWWWVGVLVANVVVTAVMMWWLLGHPNVEQSLLSPDEIDQLVNHDFEGYYSEYAASHFAASVWVNNAWVSALCLGLGILGAPVVWLLWNNVANLAVIGAIMTRHGHAGHFWGLILPHGLLELTAVFVAGESG
ncbi:MAG: stage II sporulation protein M [Nocardioides sp.]